MTLQFLFVKCALSHTADMQGADQVSSQRSDALPIYKIFTEECGPSSHDSASERTADHDEKNNIL